MENYFAGVIRIAGINLALLLPVLALCLLVSGKPRQWLTVLLFVGVFVLDIACIYLYLAARLIPFWGGLNWQGKLAELAMVVLLVGLLPSRVGATAGFWGRVHPGSWRWLGWLMLAYAMVGVPLMLMSGQGLTADVSLPTLLYQLTAPGLAEELVYRGILQRLLNAAFGKPWRVLGASCGWGLVLTSLLFGFVHGVVVQAQSGTHIYWGAMVLPLCTGLVLAWLREKSGSVWPCVVLHNWINAINTVLD